MKRTYIGEFEEIVLLMVAVLDGHAYGVNITLGINTQANRDVRLNQVHASLQRLEQKGMIASRMGDPTHERGGRRKRLFHITSFGQQTLHDIQSVRTHFWNMMSSPDKQNRDIRACNHNPVSISANQLL